MAKLINRVIKTLVVSDLFLNLGWGLLSPIFAIFILGNIAKNSPAQAAGIAGLAALFYWIPKSFFQIPIAIFLDKKHGEKDDFWFMVCGMFIAAFIPIGYLFSSAPWHIYLLQVIYAAGMAMVLPSWLAIFTRHIDKGKEAFEWGLESTSVGMGAGIAGGLSGIVVALVGFKVLFISVSALTIISTILLLLVRKHIFSRDGHIIPFSGGKPVVEP
ncbi:MAG: MFS transporter [Candidatus Staskawiczbacteria bacterium]|nr:MFS transporter [Candidatus Staskawiczbacteria bacterium]